MVGWGGVLVCTRVTLMSKWFICRGVVPGSGCDWDGVGVLVFTRVTLMARWFICKVWGWDGGVLVCETRCVPG